MPDNLRITTPITNTESINRPASAGETNRTAPVNPNRVPQATPRENANAQTGDLLLNQNSVYGQFIRQMRETPGLERTLQRLLDSLAARGMPLAAPAAGTAASPLQELSPSLRALAGSIALQADDMLKDITSQQDDATLFSGSLFRLLEKISVQSEDPQFDLRLAGFLKAYAGFSTKGDIMGAIHTGIEKLKYSIPVFYAKKLVLVEKKLSDGGADSFNSDLAVLKRELIPLLGEYVSATNDYGKNRDTISLLLQNTAILNESSSENLAGKFGQLLSYCRDHTRLPESLLTSLQAMFKEAVASGARKKSSAFAEALTRLLSGLSEDGPNETDGAMLSDITRSLLLDSSVYMPFQHIYFPAQIGGRFLFSQIWVEKRDPDETRRKIADEAVLPKNIYLSFDIQDLGYFEAAVRLTGSSVEMKLSCPKVLNGIRREIHSGVSEIMEKNGFSVEELRLSECVHPQIPRLILQKVEERKDSINVTI